MITVEFIQNCGNDCAGDVKAIDPKRARRLVMTGYARIVETETIEAPETTEKARPAVRVPKTERRG